MTIFVCNFSDPPLEEEDIPAGLWLCHMCQMLQKQRTSNAMRAISNDDETVQHEIQKLKESRPSTPITSDGVINAAKVRLNQKRSLSRVSSSSENSSSSDRDIKAKISRSNSEQNSNGADVVEIIENTATNVDDKDTEELKCIEIVESEMKLEAANETNDSKKSNEESDEKVVVIEITENAAENVDDAHQKEESQDENTPEVESVELEKDSESIDADDSAEKTVQSNEEEANEVNLKTPLDELIRAASIMNPRQFELPRELNIFPQFPGDERGKWFQIILIFY